MPTSRFDLLKALAKRGRACSNSLASRKPDAVEDTRQALTKATYRANSQKAEGKAWYVLQLYTEGHGFSALRVALSGAHTEPIKLRTDTA